MGQIGRAASWNSTLHWDEVQRGQEAKSSYKAMEEVATARVNTVLQRIQQTELGTYNMPHPAVGLKKET